jgi:hypothetical protein
MPNPGFNNKELRNFGAIVQRWLDNKQTGQDTRQRTKKVGFFFCFGEKKGLTHFCKKRPIEIHVFIPIEIYVFNNKELRNFGAIVQRWLDNKQTGQDTRQRTKKVGFFFCFGEKKGVDSLL